MADMKSDACGMRKEPMGLAGSADEQRALCEARETAASGLVDGFSYLLPETLGEGVLRTVAVHGGICVSEHRYRFSRAVSGSGASDGGSVNVHFCLGEGVEWDRTGGDDAALSLARGEAVITAGAEGSIEHVRYRKDAPYAFVSLKIPRSSFQCKVLDPLECSERRVVERAIAARSSAKLSPNMEMALHQVMHSPYRTSLSRVYREAKLVELLAVFLSEAVFGREQPSVSLSRTDREAIEQARRILDARLVDPPTYPELAHEVLLSETKLSRGFRAVYGQTVHAYLVGRRLDVARLMLARNAASVSEAACAVGYSNLSHFSAAFRKRFGVRPSSLVGSAPEQSSVGCSSALAPKASAAFGE